MRSSSGHLASHALSLALMSSNTGCAGDLGAAAAANSSPQPVTSSPGTEVVQIVGLLTLKGPEMDAWWAVTDDSGAVWRVEPSSVDQAGQFRKWQNSRITVVGLRAGAVLSTPRVRVERALPTRSGER
jgi:hypothetical protein